MKHFIIGTAGHIDHGKTSLIRALTDVDCDTHPEEKKRGITINLGFTHLQLPGGSTAGIIDVPGHKDFIHTMISGTGGIDVVLLVVAADSGMMPQTREHLEICSLLGISQCVIALTKSDLADEEWLQLQQEEIRSELSETPFAEAAIVPVSAVTRAGLEELAQQLVAAEEQLVPKSANGPFRLYIDRIFNPKGQGFVATGSVLGGKIPVGKSLHLLPGKKEYVVRSLQRFGQDVQEVRAGDRAAISLSGFKSEDFNRGMILCDQMLESSLYLDAAFTLSLNAKKLPKRNTVLLLSGTFQSQAKLILLNNKELNPGEAAIVQLIPEFPGVLLNEDRFIIRNSSGDKTLGGGYIIDNHALHHKKVTSKLIEELTSLQESYQSRNDAAGRIINQIKKAAKPISADEIKMQYAEFYDRFIDYCAENHEDILYFQEENLFIPSSWVSKVENTVLQALKEYHQKYYLNPGGLSTADLAGKSGIPLKTDAHRALVRLLNQMKGNGILSNFQNSWIAANHRPEPSKKDQEQLEWLETLFISFAMNKPVMEEIEQKAKDRQLNKEKLMMYLNYMVDQGRIYFFSGDYIHRNQVDFARKKLIEELKRKGKGINEGDFRVLIDGTKKIIHPLIGIFCREGIIKQDQYIINITELGLKN